MPVRVSVSKKLIRKKGGKSIPTDAIEKAIRNRLMERSLPYDDGYRWVGTVEGVSRGQRRRRKPMPVTLQRSPRGRPSVLRLLVNTEGGDTSYEVHMPCPSQIPLKEVRGELMKPGESRGRTSPPRAGQSESVKPPTEETKDAAATLRSLRGVVKNDELVALVLYEMAMKLEELSTWPVGRIEVATARKCILRAFPNVDSENTKGMGHFLAGIVRRGLLEKEAPPGRPAEQTFTFTREGIEFIGETAPPSEEEQKTVSLADIDARIVSVEEEMSEFEKRHTNTLKELEERRLEVEREYEEVSAKLTGQLERLRGARETMEEVLSQISDIDLRE